MTDILTILPFDTTDLDDLEVGPFLDFWPGTPDGREAALEQLRRWLREVVGCDNSLRLLLDLASEYLGEGDLADQLQIDLKELRCRRDELHRRIRFEALGEAVVAGLAHDPLVRVDPVTARLLPPSVRAAFAVTIPETRRDLQTRAVLCVVEYLQEHADELQRERELPLYLLARQGEDGTLGLGLAHVAASAAEARGLGRRLRTSQVIDLARGECVVLPRAARGSGLAAARRAA